jgi:hypothetical protein
VSGSSNLILKAGILLSDYKHINLKKNGFQIEILHILNKLLGNLNFAKLSVINYITKTVWRLVILIVILNYLNFKPRGEERTKALCP